MLFVCLPILSFTFPLHIKAAFAPFFLTLSQHFSLQERILVMLKSQTKLPEFQVYVGTYAMICLQQSKLISEGGKQ